MNTKRLNDQFLNEDLSKWINECVKRNILGSYLEVLDWKNQYYKDIDINKAALCQRFQDIFPQSVVKIEGGHDDVLTFFIQVYGLNDLANSHTNDEKLKKAELLAELLDGIDYNDGAAKPDDYGAYSDYCLIVGKKEDKVTRQYYPQIWEEVLKVRGHSDKEYEFYDYKAERLYNADPNCKHNVDAQWSGVKCTKCSGWFCY